MKIEVVKSKSLLGGYNLLINGTDRRFVFVMKRDAIKKKNDLLNGTIQLINKIS